MRARPFTWYARFLALSAVVAALAYGAQALGASGATSAPYIGQPPNPSRYAWGIDEAYWYSASNNPATTQNCSGTSAAVSLSGTVFTGRPGVYQITTGTTATGYCSLYWRDNLSTEKWEAGYIIRTPTAVSDGTNTYTLRVGSQDNLTGGSGSDGILFRYTHSENSGKWLAVSRAATVETTADTGVAVAGGTWYHLRIVAGETASGAHRFYINGALVATISSGLPGLTLRPTAAITKTVGTSASIMYVDAIYWRQRVTR